MYMGRCRISEWGVRVEAPKASRRRRRRRGGTVWGGVSPSPVWVESAEGLCPSQKFLFIFLCGNDALWCTFEFWRRRNFFHSAVELSDITVLQQDTQTSSMAVQEQCCCMLALINLNFQRLYCWHTYDCPFVAARKRLGALCNFLY